MSKKFVSIRSRQEEGPAAAPKPLTLADIAITWTEGKGTWMVREEITPRNPAAQVFLLATQKTLPSYLSITEQEQVLATLATRTDLLGRRDYALVATALFTGLRCSEPKS